MGMKTEVNEDMIGEPTGSSKPKSAISYTIHALLVWAVLVTVAFLSVLSTNTRRGVPTPQTPVFSPAPLSHPKRNVIFMISDGMGPASVALARNFFEYTQDAGLDTLALDEYFIGNSRTQSSDSFITDSAAGATAFSCCLKTYNGAIGVDPNAKPCASIMEAAKLHGYRTGMVVTTRITDATPASFAAHAHDRSEEDFIALQLVNHEGSHPLGQMVDLLFGGGKCRFRPNSDPESCRRDDRDLLAGAKSDGFHFVNNTDELRDYTSNFSPEQLPVLGLFTDGDLPFGIDRRDDSTPKLSESALSAAYILGNATKDSDKGFFLMVEGSRIDHAGHFNDPGAQVHEVLDYSEAFEAIAKYAENSEIPTIVISTSDHETGGLSVSRQVSKSYPEYLWYPEVLERSQHSTQILARELKSAVDVLDEGELHTFIRSRILGPEGLNFVKPTNEEVEKVLHHRNNAQAVLSNMLSVRAQVGWATHGHSGVDVNVYGASNHPEVLKPLWGGNENTDIGHYMRQFMRIKGSALSDLTEDLREGFGNKF